MPSRSESERPPGLEHGSVVDLSRAEAQPLSRPIIAHLCFPIGTVSSAPSIPPTSATAIERPGASPLRWRPPPPPGRRLRAWG